MADKAKNVVLNFKMDGQVQYANTLKQINAVMNSASKEYRNHIAAMGNDASATDKLRAEKKKLEIQMEGSKKRTKMLRDEYDAMAKDTSTTTEQLTKMYNRVLDAENAEIKLQKSLERVNDGLSDQAQEAREAMSELDGMKSESKLLEAEQKSLTSAFKLQNAELGKNASEADRAELAQKQLKSQMELTERTVSNLERQLTASKKIYGENSIEVMQLESKLNNARTTIKKFGSSLDGIDDSSKKANDGISKLGKKMDLNNMLEATEMLQGISDKLIEIGNNSVAAALLFGDSQVNLQANLGLTEEEAEKLNEVVDEVFRNGVVPSVEDATQAVIITKQAFKDLNNVELENLTNKIIAVSKRTGTDVQENVKAAQKMMMEFGLSGEEALDLIGYGYQNNLNKAGDFTDAIDEFSPLFADAGFSADQMLGLMQNGLEGGALHATLAGDAVKELQIRFGDGSFEKNIDKFSKGTQGLFKDWQNGKVSMSEVMASIQKDIQKMDSSKQQEALSLLATQFEDLGVRGSVSLLGVSDSLVATTGKAEEFAQKAPGEKWESSMRELQESLIPIGQSIVDTLTPIIDTMAKLGDWFNKLPGPVKTFTLVFGALVTIIGIATPIILALAAAVTALEVPLLPIIGTVLAVTAAIAALIAIGVALYKNWDTVKAKAVELWNKLGPFKGVFLALTGPIGTLISMGIKLYKNWDTIKEKAEALKEKVANLFTGIKWELPKLKLPKISVSGKFSLDPPSIPKFKIKWNAKGAIFTQPTIFGVYGGQLQGGGEAGPEAALPLNEENLSAIGRGIASTMRDIKQSIQIIMMTPDAQVLAEMVVDPVTEIQEFKKNRFK
jgi:phage-related minor tail protein